MPIVSTRHRYGSLLQALHWLTAVLVVAAYFVADGRSGRGGRPDEDTFLHETLGMAIFVLVAIRLLWRVLDHGPEAEPIPFVMRAGARAMHLALYALLIVVPVTGILGAWFEGYPVTVIGVGQFLPWVARNEDFGEDIADIHELLGNAMIWLAGAHAGAALFHHFVRRDGVMRQMLPGRS